jgi:hypothetical protein
VTSSHDVWTDPELREFVRRSPDLVAIADALAEAKVRVARARPPRVLVRRLRPLAVAAALVAAVAVALVAPWSHSGEGSLSDRALAAIGSQPVLHVIAEIPTDAVLIDISSGNAHPVYEQHEIRYDAGRDLKRSTVRVGGEVLDDTLETPQGAYTTRGIVYDCTWIAAHPTEATKAHVSCTPSGDNGTTPRVVPRPKPTVDPGLAGFVDDYRRALAVGDARAAGSGYLDGKRVDWIIFQTSDGSEKVALDQTTHKPVLVQTASGRSVRIETIETVPYASPDFGPPTPDEVPAQPSGGSATEAKVLALDGSPAANAFPGAFWSATVAGMPLVKATQQSLRVTFAQGAPAQTGIGLELDYGALDANGRPDWSKQHVQIQEAPRRELGYGNRWGFVRGDAPPPGQLYASSGAGGRPLTPSSPLALGFTVIDGVYVTIQASTSELLLQTARSLQRTGG